MKQTRVALLAVAALSSAFALPNFDPFADATANGGTSYAVGAGLAPNTNNAGSGWNLVGSNFISTNPQPMIVEGNLTYPDLPASTGNSVSNTPPAAGSGASARMDLTNNTVNTTYYSLLLKVTDLSAVPASAVNNPIAAFSDTLGGQGAGIQRMGGRLVTMTSGGGYLLGVGKGSTVADYRYDSTVRGVGDVLFVVVSYERVGGVTNVNLWVNPPSSSFGVEPPPTPVASVPQGSAANDLNDKGVRALVLACQYTTSPSCIIDEVRVATNWAYVTGGTPNYPAAITSQPASRTVKVGDRVAFVVGATGTSPTYQWRLNATDIPGATDAAYPIASAQTTDAGSYTVVVNNLLNLPQTSSPPAVLTVSTTPLQLYETNLLVVRVGDGAQTLARGGNSVFLDQFTPAGAYLNTIFVPDTGPSAVIESGPDLAGSVLTGAALTRSADKRLLALSGYNVALGNTTALDNTYATNVPRAVVTIDAGSQVTLAVANTNAYTGAHFRGAATDGANNFWGAGNQEGTWYFGTNSPAALVQTSYINTRSVDIFNGNLYALASASGANGLIKFNGLPTTDQGAVSTLLPGFNSTTTTDFAVDPTDTLIYLTAGATVQKWQFAGSSWANVYNLTAGLTEQVRYLTVDFSGPAPVLYLTTAEAGNGFNRLLTIVDTNSTATAVTLATSGPNQLFKGIRFGPIASAARPTLSLTREGSDIILSWSGPFTLVSSTNAAGPYLDVSPVTNPYTNSTLSPEAKFFGLRQN